MKATKFVSPPSEGEPDVPVPSESEDSDQGYNSLSTPEEISSDEYELSDSPSDAPDEDDAATPANAGNEHSRTTNETPSKLLISKTNANVMSSKSRKETKALHTIPEGLIAFQDNEGDGNLRSPSRKNKIEDPLNNLPHLAAAPNMPKNIPSEGML